MAVSIGRRKLIAALGDAAAWPIAARAHGVNVRLDAENDRIPDTPGMVTREPQLTQPDDSALATVSTSRSLVGRARPGTSRRSARRGHQPLPGAPPKRGGSGARER
jgi:hypothetical protein